MNKRHAPSNPFKKITPGKIIVPAGINVWPHELKTAEALAKAGYTVRFKQKSEEQKVHSADAYINSRLWEFKAPKGARLEVVEKNLRRAKRQSHYIVFDSRRIKKIPDFAIWREILAQAPRITEIQEIIFINRHGKCIDIYYKKR